MNMLSPLNFWAFYHSEIKNTTCLHQKWWYTDVLRLPAASFVFISHFFPPLIISCSSSRNLSKRHCTCSIWANPNLPPPPHNRISAEAGRISCTLLNNSKFNQLKDPAPIFPFTFTCNLIVCRNRFLLNNIQNNRNYINMVFVGNWGNYWPFDSCGLIRFIDPLHRFLSNKHFS